MLANRSITTLRTTSYICSRHFGEGALSVPKPFNDRIRTFLPGSEELKQVQQTLKQFRENPVEIPLVINGKEHFTGERKEIRPPYDHKSVVGYYYEANREQVKEAIAQTLDARKQWASLSADHRLSIFLKMADLLRTDYRPKLLAATILGQGKNLFQAEIDTSCELIDFLRFNAYYAQKIYEDQPISDEGIWNRSEYRALEGFVYAITPFNFTAIAGNLACSPAMMGNVVLWKPSNHSMLSSYWLTQLYKDSGLPDGVINMIPADPVMVTEEVLNHPELAGVHYTGSTQVFKNIWKTVGNNIDIYKNYPRIVGETGGKDFIFAHSSSKVSALVTAIVRGAFEFQGQKCSAASRAFIPASIWPEVKKQLLEQISQIKVGNVEDVETLVGAVIHKDSFKKASSYIEYAKNDKNHTIIAGGTYDDSVGYFIHPTVIQTTDPINSRCFNEEIFAPIMTIFVYEDSKFSEALDICENHSYGLTGSIFAQDRYAVAEMMKRLQYGAGNFYINDKPTGAVVGQQPFGGSRLSGTNDKAGSSLNLLRWTSVRSIKETFNPPTHFSYPYMKKQ